MVGVLERALVVAGVLAVVAYGLAQLVLFGLTGYMAYEAFQTADLLVSQGRDSQEYLASSIKFAGLFFVVAQVVLHVAAALAAFVFNVLWWVVTGESFLSRSTVG